MGKSSECIGGEFLMADNVSPILMTDYLVTDVELTAVADTIRGKAGTAGQLSFPDGFVSAIQGIKTEPTLQEKTVSPSTLKQTITPDNGYDGLSKVIVNELRPVALATPSITVLTAGKITASVSQSAGYVAGDTKSATKQLTTQAAKTVTPGTADQTAVASERYTTGAVTVKGDANLVAGNIKSGVSIFGVAGSLNPGSSKGMKFTSINETKSISVDLGGHAKITVGSAVVAEYPNIIYAEGTASNGGTVRFVRTGDGAFYGSEYSSDAQGYYDTSVPIYETTNTDGSKSWEWLIDPSGAGPATITIKTIVMGA